MRTENLLISLMGLVLGFLLLFGGIFLFLPPFVPALARAMQALVSDHLSTLSFLGLICAFVGFGFLTLFLWLCRRRYLLVQMGVFVEDHLIADLAKDCLQHFFPGQRVDCDVIVKRKKNLEILANIPFIEENLQEPLLKEIEQALAAMLHKQCLYNRKFIFNVSFLAG